MLRQNKAWLTRLLEHLLGLLEVYAETEQSMVNTSALTSLGPVGGSC